MPDTNPPGDSSQNPASTSDPGKDSGVQNPKNDGNDFMSPPPGDKQEIKETTKSPEVKEVNPTVTPPIQSSSPGMGSGSNQANASNLNIPPVVNITGEKMKKFGGRKLIATILSILLLIGGIGAGVALVGQQQDIREKAGSPPCGTGCGIAPDSYPYNSPRTDISGFDGCGKFIVYYTPLQSPANRKLYLEHEGTQYTIDLAPSGQQKFVTNIQVEPGDSVILKNIEELETSIPECAPDKSSPYYEFGWINVNPDLTCGSGLPGPPTGGSCAVIPNQPVGDHISWAEGDGNPILSKQCWADWQEWPGDYDFEDFFLMFAYEDGSCDVPTPTPTPTGLITPTPTPTASPSASAFCDNIIIYSVDGDKDVPANWTVLTDSALEALEANDVVYLSARGFTSDTTLTNGGFTDATFTVNGDERQKVYDFKPRDAGADPEYWEIYDVYTIPEDTAHFAIDVKLCHESGCY